MNMGWSIRVVDIAGTSVRIHLTFFLLLAWFGISSWMQGGPAAAIDSLIFILLLFGCVVLHEFGHVFAARRYGIRTPDVTVLPIGGLARLERMPEKPGEEFVVAIAGPLVNVVIALVLIVFLGASFNLSDMAEIEKASSSLTARLAAANVALVLFNLIPAFPMDGGRVLRALLATRFSYVRATQIAARAGQVIAVGFGFVGLLGSPLLVLIAVFIFFAASTENAHIEMRELARGFLACDAMITKFEPLAPAATLGDAADLLLRTTQQEFPVVDGGHHLRGVLTRSQLISALQQNGRSAPVLETMERNVPTVGERACMETVMESLQNSGTQVVAVTHMDGRLAGYITAENFAEMAMVQGAVRAQVGNG